VGWLAGITKRVKLCAGMRFYSVRVTRGVSQRSYRGAKYLRSAKSFPVCGCSKIRELMCDIFSEVGFSREPTRRILEFGVVAVTGSKRPLGCMVSSGLLMASPQHNGVAAHVRKERAKLRAALQKSIEKDIRSGELDVSANAVLWPAFTRRSCRACLFKRLMAQLRRNLWQ
jgi:hypothetical protein